MICGEGLRPEDPSLLEPLAGPLPVAEGGEILEPLSVPMPAPGSEAVRRPHGAAGPAARTISAAPASMKSFWSFGGEGPGPRRAKVMDWRGPRW